VDEEVWNIVEHCWHRIEDGRFQNVAPPRFLEKCCFCGAVRMVMGRASTQHGKHLLRPIYEFVPYEASRECIEREVTR